MIAKVDKKQAPEVPIKRPKRIQEIKLKKGNNKIHRYIKNQKKKLIYHASRGLNSCKDTKDA